MPGPIQDNDDQAIQAIISQGVNIGITFTAAEIFGATMSLADVIKVIEPLDRDSCLMLLGVLNWKCMWVQFTSEDGWRSAAQELDDLITQFLPPPLRLKARLLANDDAFAGPVSELALLTLAGLVCRFGAKSGGFSADTQRVQRDLFHALLGVQGGISGKSPDLWQTNEMFSRTTQVVWRNISLQNMLARDLARLHAYLMIPEIGSGLHEPVASWFEKHLGVNGGDYEAIANSLHGAASLRADFSVLFDRFPEVAKRMLRLIQLCSTTPETVAVSADAQCQLNSSDCDAINEAQKLADEFFRSPLLQIQGRVVCISSRLLFNRLHRGLHYLVVEPYQGNADAIKQVRAECGTLFERYIVWLLKQFLPADKIEIVHSFRVKPDGAKKKGVEPAERDVALIVGRRAFVFEIKSAIPTLANRRRAEVNDFVGLYRQAIDQVLSASNALLSGTAFRDVALTKRLPTVEAVVPCIICFEPSPLRFPVALEFEKAVSSALQMQPFERIGGRLPLQLFDVEAIEEFGDVFGLPTDWEQLLDAIAARALKPHLRYKPVHRSGGRQPDENDQGSSVLPTLVSEAAQVSSTRWRELTANPLYP